MQVSMFDDLGIDQNRDNGAGERVSVMQVPMFNNSGVRFKQVPTLVAKGVGSDYIAVRFRQIGNPQKFKIILDRFRYDFPLANCQEISGQPWWIVAASQFSALEAFAKRNGLQIRKES